MQNCKKCQITIRGTKERCPLCGGTLSGEPEKNVFPVIPRAKVSRMSFIRVSLFLFIVFEAVMIVLGAVTEEWPVWIFLAMGAALVGIIDVSLAVYYMNNLLQLVVIEMYIGLGVTMLVDLYTGAPYWSVTWVLPAAFPGLMITTAAIGKGTRRQVREYIMYLLFDVIVSTVLQGIFILTGVNSFRMPAIISMAFVIVFFAGMVIFNHRVFGKETKKLFNV